QAAAAAPSAWKLGAALAASAALLALWSYRAALGAFFSPDDFLMLEKARGIAPSAPSLWRAIAGPGYFALAGALFGARPLPYHVVNWLLHGANAALLYFWVRSRGGGRAAAWTAGGLFGSSRLYLSAVFPATGVGELLALGLTLGALGLAERR